MSDTDNTVDTVTDDLDAFSEAFFNPKEQEAEEPVVEDNDTTGEAEAEDAEATDDDSVETDDDETSDDEESAESDPDGDKEELEPEPKKRRKSAQERIDELTREKYEERREFDKKLAELEARLNLSAKEEKVEDKPVGKLPDGAPDPHAQKEDGDAIYPLGEFDPAYIRDLTRYTIDQEQEAAKILRETREREAADTAARESARTQWNEKLEAAEKELPDVRDKINSLEKGFTGVDANYGQYLVDVVMALDNGPQVLHYLADKPKEFQEIVSSGPASATIRLGRLDAIMAKVTKEEVPKKVTKAAPPPSKITRGTGTKGPVAGDTDDLDAFARVYFKK